MIDSLIYESAWLDINGKLYSVYVDSSIGFKDYIRFRDRSYQVVSIYRNQDDGLVIKVR